MHKKILLYCLVLLGNWANASVVEDLNKLQNSIDVLKKRIKNRSEPALIVRATDTIIAHSADSLDSYKKIFPACDESFTMIFNHQIKMRIMSPAAIKLNYIDGIALPRSPSYCDDFKNILVRPFMIRALAKTSSTKFESMHTNAEKLQASYRKIQVESLSLYNPSYPRK